MRPRALAVVAILLSLAVAGAFMGLLAVLAVPLRPALYLSGLALAAILALAALWRVRDRVTISAVVVSGLLLVLAGLFHFVVMRVPPGQPLVTVGQAAPNFTLPDAAGRAVSLADYRDRKPVVLVFYRGYW